jgi:DNA mismatch endonuclease (patch repair protein)
MMAELLTDTKTSQRLARIRQSGTAPELAVRRVAYELGLRYRVSNRDLPGSPDLANRTKRWAMFVHGCFWHHHEGCTRATVPKRNRTFWVEKFEANKRRDAARRDELLRMGFDVLTLWECQTQDPFELRCLIEAWRGTSRD